MGLDEVGRRIGVLTSSVIYGENKWGSTIFEIILSGAVRGDSSSSDSVDAYASRLCQECLGCQRYFESSEFWRDSTDRYCATGPELRTQYVARSARAA